MIKNSLYASLLFLIGVQHHCLAYDCPQFNEAYQVGTVQNSSADEISGIAASRKNPDVFWIHNDHSGSETAIMYAMTSSGRHIVTFVLSGAIKRDYEDIAIGPGPIEGIDYIYVGDIGDNDSVYSSVTIYRIPEPVIDANSSYSTQYFTDFDTINLQYPTGPRDAEILMVDPSNADIYIVTKRINPTQVYKASYPQSTTETTTLSFMTTINGTTRLTGGDISSDGKYVIITDYFQNRLWPILSGQQPWQAFANQTCSVPSISQPQREAICFSPNSRDYYTTSEGDRKPIYIFQKHLETDFNSDNIVNFKDFALLFDNESNLSTFFDYSDLKLLADEWLRTIN